MAKDTDYLNELYWELLRRTPEYRNFYDKNRRHKYLTKEQQEFLEERGLYKPSPSLFGKYWNLNPDIVAGFMATKEFGVYFTKHDNVFHSRNPQKLFSESAPIISPDIPYSQAPYKVTFLFPPDIELIECRELRIPSEGEPPSDRFMRISTAKQEALFRIRLDKSPRKLAGEFEREIRKIRNALKEAGKLKISPLFGTFFPRSFLRRIKRNTFYQYLRWYDLYMGLKNIPGISFSAIASLEKLKKFKKVDTQKVIDTITGKSDFHFPELDKVNASLVSKVTKGIKVIDQIISKTPLKLSPGRKKDTIKPPPILRDRVGMWETEARTTGGGKRTPKRQSLDEQESSFKTLPLKYRQIKK